MHIFVQFSETYLEWISQVCFSIKQKMEPEPVAFCGLALRRKTVCPKLDAMAESMGLGQYDWLNDIEKRVLASDMDVSGRLEHYRRILGDKKLRLIINCDRELGGGGLTGGVYARTRLKRMMERDPDLRWKYVVGMLDYYADRFKKENPDLIFFNEVSFAWEMAAYLMAEHLGIPFAVLCYVRSGMGYAIIGNASDQCESVDSLFEQSATHPEMVHEYLKDAETMLVSFRENPARPGYTVAFEKKIKRGATARGILRTLVVDLMKCAAIKGGLLGTRGVLRFENWLDMTRWNFQAAMQTKKCLRSHRVFVRSEKYLQDDYLYYPLHVEPESSTMVLSAKMTNQLFFIEQLSKNMPAGFKLLVKEHLSMLGRRPKGFYQRIKTLPDVVLVSPLENNFELIRHASVVCVLTGTSGWEAIMQGVPVLVVGQAQYLGINAGFVRCESLLQLDRSIQQALAINPVPDEVLIRFIAASMSCLSGMDAHSIAYWHYGISPEESIKEDGIDGVASQLIDFYRSRVSAAEDSTA